MVTPGPGASEHGAGDGAAAVLTPVRNAKGTPREHQSDRMLCALTGRPAMTLPGRVTMTNRLLAGLSAVLCASAPHLDLAGPVEQGQVLRGVQLLAAHKQWAAERTVR